MRKSIKENYIYNLMYQLMAILIPLVTTPYISRILGATAIGDYSYTSGIVSYFGLVAATGTVNFAQKKIAVYESQSTDIQKRLAQKDEINAKYQQIIHRRSIIRELEELFKGNAFIEYVAESRLRYIAKEASSILSHISNGNYTLDVNDATEFVIRDNKNGGVLRAADTLSGGEIFITSLSLALALSSSIQLNGSAPLELFFLDEGFGSLDDELLNIVMDSLERIKTDRRSIGIISHVENLKERVPVKLLIEPSQNTGSGSHIRVQYS